MKLELPELGIVKKVKSMQMFKRPVQDCAKGDRLGICVTQLDPKLIERGMLAAPGTIPRFSTAVVLAQKIRYYKGRRALKDEVPCYGGTRYSNGYC